MRKKAYTAAKIEEDSFTIQKMNISFSPENIRVGVWSGSLIS